MSVSVSSWSLSSCKLSSCPRSTHPAQKLCTNCAKHASSMPKAEKLANSMTTAAITRRDFFAGARPDLRSVVKCLVCSTSLHILFFYRREVPATGTGQRGVVSKGQRRCAACLSGQTSSPHTGSPIVVPQTNRPAPYLVVCLLYQRSFELYWAVVCSMHLSRTPMSL